MTNFQGFDNQDLLSNSSFSEEKLLDSSAAEQGGYDVLKVPVPKLLKAPEDSEQHIEEDTKELLCEEKKTHLRLVPKDHPVRSSMADIREKLSSFIQDNLRPAASFGFVEEKLEPVSVKQLIIDLQEISSNLQIEAEPQLDLPEGMIDYSSFAQESLKVVTDLLIYFRECDIWDDVDEMSQEDLFHALAASRKTQAAYLNQLDEVSAKLEENVGEEEGEASVIIADAEMTAYEKAVFNIISGQIPPTWDLGLKLYQASQELLSQHAARMQGHIGYQKEREPVASIDEYIDTLSEVSLGLEHIVAEDSDRSSIGVNFRKFAQELQNKTDEMLIHLKRGPYTGEVPDSHFPELLGHINANQSHLMDLLRQLKMYLASFELDDRPEAA